MSLHHVTATASLPLDWTLFLPEEWTEDPARCAAAGVPEPVTGKTKWELALELIDRARHWGLADQVIVADAGYAARLLSAVAPFTDFTPEELRELLRHTQQRSYRADEGIFREGDPPTFVY